MENYSKVINAVNAYLLAFDDVHREGVHNIDLNLGVETLWDFFTKGEECSIDLELYGTGTGEAQVKQVLLSHLSLDFLSNVCHTPSGHVVTFESNDKASCTSYVVAYFKCNPIIVTKYIDSLILVDSEWKFQSRKCVDVQKNFELLADMQLRGKKSYSPAISAPPKTI